jgi:hypothetical protein
MQLSYDHLSINEKITHTHTQRERERERERENITLSCVHASIRCTDVMLYVMYCAGAPSAQTLNTYPYLVPLFIAIIAISSMFCFGSYQAASWIASIALAMIFIIAPLIFIYQAIAFPALLVVHDACYGGENVGYQYINGRKGNPHPRYSQTRILILLPG